MGWGILEGKLSHGGKGAVFYDSAVGRAFGPLFDSATEAEAFALFVGGDPRLTTATKMDKEFLRFRASDSSRRKAPRVAPRGRIKHAKKRRRKRATIPKR
jgi:hypothetical protein